MPDDALPVRFIAQDQWQSLSNLFRQAEAALHEAEMIHGDLGIPSVNQLRYAGHHILSISTSATEAEAIQAYHKAVSHCQRAIYDAYDSAIVYMLKGIKAFKEDYAKIQIGPHFARYPELRKTARDAKDLLVKAREKPQSREAYYGDCRVLAEKLRSCYDEMEDAREELNKAIEHHNVVVYIGYVSLAAAIVAAVAAVLALL